MTKRRLEWSVFALNDRTAIFDYLQADSPQAAIAVDERIEEQLEALLKFPEMGRPGRIAGTRELVIQRTPYIAPIRSQAKRSESCACSTQRSSGRSIWARERGSLDTYDRMDSRNSAARHIADPLLSGCKPKDLKTLQVLPQVQFFAINTLRGTRPSKSTPNSCVVKTLRKK